MYLCSHTDIQNRLIPIFFNSLNFILVNFRYDFVSVRDGGTTQSPLVGRYCGHSLPTSHISTGNQLVIRFKSDHSVSHEGFRASYRAGTI